MPNPWFRLYTEFEDDPKVVMMPEAMQLRLVKVFCSRCKEANLTDRQRAFKWGISTEELAETKALFLAEGFIDENWNPVKWLKRQFPSDSSTDRTKRYRERKRTSQQRDRDGDGVTGVTERDAPEESREEKSREEEIRVEQKRLDQRRAATDRPAGRRGGEPKPVSSISLISPSHATPPLHFPTTVSGLVAGGFNLSNSKPCTACGEVIDWWSTPKGGQLPMNAGSAVVHMETCQKVARNQG